MKIVACIKYSMDVSEIKVDKETEAIKLAGVPKTVGTIDQNILEAAVALAEKFDGKVHGLSYAPPEAKDAFRDALAMGLEDMTLVEAQDVEQITPAVTARVLAAAVRKIGDVDIVVCGEVSDDGFTYQVPPRLAERLGIPQLSFARSLTYEEGRLLVERELDDGSQVVSAPLPVLVSVTEETNTPRRPTLMEAMQAKKKTVHRWTLEEDLGLHAAELESCIHLEKVDTRGIVVHRKQKQVEGKDPAEMAESLVNILIEDGVLEGGAA